MGLAEKLSITAAFVFFMTGLLTGIWKYRCMASSPNGSAPVYVNVAHRSSLMYSFAALLLAYFANLSGFSDLTNTLAASAALTYFALAIFTYLVHGWLDDTSNQLRKPHRLGDRKLPSWLTPLFMWTLIVAEVGGVAVLGIGALQTVWS